MKSAIIVLTLPVTVAAQEPIGDFYLMESSDPITDEKTAFIATPSQSDETVLLVWSCINGVLRAAVSTSNAFLGSRVDAIWRFDRNPPSERLNVETAESAMILVPQSRTAEFTQRARAGTQVAVRLFAGQEMLTHIFSLNGVTGSLRRLDCQPPPRDERIGRRVFLTSCVGGAPTLTLIQLWRTAAREQEASWLPAGKPSTAPCDGAIVRIVDVRASGGEEMVFVRSEREDHSGWVRSRFIGRRVP